MVDATRTAGVVKRNQLAIIKDHPGLRPPLHRRGVVKKFFYCKGYRSTISPPLEGCPEGAGWFSNPRLLQKQHALSTPK